MIFSKPRFFQKIRLRGAVCISLKSKKLFPSSSCELSKLENFQINKVPQLKKSKSLLVRNYFQFLVQQHLRHSFDHESFSIKSNMPPYPFFSALWSSKLVIIILACIFQTFPKPFEKRRCWYWFPKICQMLTYI